MLKHQDICIGEDGGRGTHTYTHPKKLRRMHENFGGLGQKSGEEAVFGRFFPIFSDFRGAYFENWHRWRENFFFKKTFLS